LHYAPPTHRDLHSFPTRRSSDLERQRQAARDQGVLAAEQQPLDDGVDPGHVAKPPDLGRVPSPKSAATTWSRLTSGTAAASATRPSSRHTRPPHPALARRTPCPTT